MTHSAFVFLVGCDTISALPPLNGFVSEWLTFQAILLSPELPSWALKILIPAVGALLALSAALAAACFVKAFGVTFLGRPRTAAAETAKETDRYSRAAMFFFAGLCLLVGVLPGVFIDALAPVTERLVGAHLPVPTTMAWPSPPNGSTGSSSSRSGSISVSFSAPWSSCFWCSRYGASPRPCGAVRADAGGARARAAADRLRAQGEGAAVAPAGPSAHPALSRSRPA